MNNQTRDFLNYLRKNLQNYFIEKDIFEVIHNNYMYNTSSFLFERCNYTLEVLLRINTHLNTADSIKKISNIENNNFYRYSINYSMFSI